MMRGAVVLGLLAAGGCGDAGLLLCNAPGVSNLERCKAADVEPAPAELDSIIHFLWRNYETATDVQLSEVITNLHTAVEGSTRTMALQRSVSDMTADDLAVVNMGHVNPAQASGMVVVTVITCTPDGADRVVRAPNQGELYDGVYDSYARTFTSDFDAYAQRSTPTLTWRSDIEATLLSNAYTESVLGGVRWVTAEEGNPLRPFLVTRTWLPSPAVFDRPGSEWNQDFQIEAYWQKSPTEVLHLWAMWRQMRIGNLSTDDDSVVELQLSRMLEWDQRTGQLCVENRP